MCFEPIDPRAHFSFYGHSIRQWKCASHTIQDDWFYFLDFFFNGVKDQFIMHLQNHPRFEFLLLECFMQFHHRELDHICGSTLNGGVDSIALSKAADSKI